MKQDNFIKLIASIRKVGIPEDVKNFAKTFINTDKIDQSEALTAAFKLARVEPNSVQKYAIDILSNPNAYNYGSLVYGYPRALANSRGVINAMETNNKITSKYLPILDPNDYGKLRRERRKLSTGGNTIKQVKILEALGLIEP
jgi:hypothetical protein